ncbi:MAG: plastocyanin/azurin family copper-binding protein [Candidatus Caldarchaeum sp.]
MLIALASVVGAVLVLSIYFSFSKNVVEHVVVIQSGAFIPPQNWTAGQRLFKDIYFKPANITIKKGDAVVWVNRDSVTHTVTETRGFFDAVINPGETYKVVFHNIGTYVYTCTIHPWKGGRITVS